MPRYIPTGPKSRTPESHGQTSGGGSGDVTRTGRLHTTGTALTKNIVVNSESPPGRCKNLFRTKASPFRLVPNRATREAAFQSRNAGRTISTAPTQPINAAVHRKAVTRSCRISVEKPAL